MGDEVHRLFDPATITPWDLVIKVLSLLVGWIPSGFARKAGPCDRTSSLLRPTTRSLAERIVTDAIVLLGFRTDLPRSVRTEPPAHAAGAAAVPALRSCTPRMINVIPHRIAQKP